MRVSKRPTFARASEGSLRLKTDTGEALEHQSAQPCFPRMAQSSPVGSRALIPNPSLKSLHFLIGEWRTTGLHPMVPGTELTGRTSFAWHEGGAFIIMHSQVDEPRFPDGVAIIGSDDSDGALAMIYFDERGKSRLMDATVGDGTLTWRHDNSEFAQCLTITVEGDRLVSRGRMSQKGGPWQDDLSQTFLRVGG